MYKIRPKLFIVFFSVFIFSSRQMFLSYKTISNVFPSLSLFIFAKFGLYLSLGVVLMQVSARPRWVTYSGTTVVWYSTPQGSEIPEAMARLP